MQKELISLFNQNTEATLDAARKLGELNLRTMDRLLQQQAEVFNAYMAVNAKGMELFAKAKGMQELISGQAELTREFGERTMEALRKGLTLANESGAEYQALVQEGVKTAQEQLNQATSTTLKAAA
jgi:hypothetical protein